MAAAARTLVLLLAVALSTSTAWAASDVLCQTYIVQSGDSLWSIANQFKVLQSDLVSALQQCVGYTSGSSLAVGQKVCIPPYVPACDYVINSGGVSTCKAYKIQPGDTAASIASSFGIYTQDLLDANSGVTGVLQVGSFIRLPPWSSTCPDPDSDAASCRVYVVQAGDFVFGIASIFRVSMADLLAINPGLQSSTLLQAGQRIRIPPFTSACSNGIIASPPTTGVFSCRAYKVKQGDSLSGIALLFETTVAGLVQVNPELANPSLLTPGYIVKIAPYPAECVNGILIDPTGSSPAVPAGPVASPSPVVATSPSPSPSPAVVVASPSPSVIVASPSPSPAVVVASPSPSPSPSGSSAPSTGIKATVTLLGANAATVTTKTAQIAAIIANVLSVPSTWVSVSIAPATTRRLHATTDSTAVVITVATATPTATAAKLQSAIMSGQLSQLLAPLGMSATSAGLSVTAYGTAPSPVAAPSPAPAPTTTPVATPEPSSGGSGSNIGAIVGGAVGGAVGVALLAGVTWYIIHKRRAAGGASYSAPSGGVTANINTGSGLSVKTGRTAKLAEDQGFSSSPRNTVTPRTRMGNLA